MHYVINDGYSFLSAKKDSDGLLVELFKAVLGRIGFILSDLGSAFVDPSQNLRSAIQARFDLLWKCIKFPQYVIWNCSKVLRLFHDGQFCHSCHRPVVFSRVRVICMFELVNNIAILED
jgi:hypothetical protein